MKRFFTKHGIIVLTVAVIIAVGLCIVSAMNSGTGFLYNAVGVVTSPFRAAGSAVSGWVSSAGDHFESVESLQKENQELRKKVAELEKDLRSAEKAREENERLRTLLNLRQQREDFTFASSHVVGRSTSNWEAELTLDVGTDADVAIGDCVVNEEGFLVGVISEVGLNWATVTTILDPNSQLGATVFRTGETTVALGDLGLMLDNRLKLSYLQGDSHLMNGDLVLTSGIGGYYPSGLVIGAVEEIRTDDNGLTRYGVLVPQVNLQQLKQVFVITSFQVVQ